jgi:hypothetical protein
MKLRDIFLKEFEKHFSSLECFPCINTTFPNNQDYALVAKPVVLHLPNRTFSNEEANTGMFLQ